MRSIKSIISLVIIAVALSSCANYIIRRQTTDLLVLRKKDSDKKQIIPEHNKIKITTYSGMVLEGKFEIENDSTIVIERDACDIKDIYKIDKKFTRETWDLEFTNRYVQNVSDYCSINKWISFWIKSDVFNNEIIKYGLTDGDTLVDIGCGSGFFDPILSYYYPNMFFVLEDIVNYSTPLSKTYQVKDKSINLKDRHLFVQGTDESIPLPSSRYKTVLCRLTVHEFRNPSAMAKELNRILAPDGLLIIVESTSDAGLKDSNTKMIMPSKEHIIEMFTTNGFKLIQETTAYPGEFLIILKFTK